MGNVVETSSQSLILKEQFKIILTNEITHPCVRQVQLSSLDFLKRSNAVDKNS